MAIKERTLLVIKPDGVERRLERVILSQVKSKGLEVRRRRMLWLTKEFVEDHYRPHVGKPYFAGLLKYMMRGPVIAFEIFGEYAVHKIRELAGETNPKNAPPLCWRGQYGIVTESGGIENVVHSSATIQEARDEITMFFEREGAGFIDRTLRRIGLRK